MDYRRSVGALITRRHERVRVLRFPCLADEYAEEHGVEAAFEHFGQVQLGIEALGVIPLVGEIRRLEVDVRVEGNDALVDVFGRLHD